MTDVVAGKVPVLKCFEDSWRFFFAHWRLLVPAAAAPALASGMAPLLGGGATLGGLIGTLVSMAGSVFFTAAVLRKAVRDEFIAPTGLAFAADEMRLFGVLGCMLAIFVPAILLVSVVLWVFVLSRVAATPEALEQMMADPEAFTEAVIAALGSGGALALDLFILILFALAIVLLVRLSMINAATIGEQRVVVFQTWSWSRGNVLRMMAAMILTGLPVMLVNVFLAEFLLSVVTPASGAPASPLAVGLGAALLGFLGALLSIPMIALGAIFYKGLRPPDFVAK